MYENKNIVSSDQMHKFLKISQLKKDIKFWYFGHKLLFLLKKTNTDNARTQK